MLAGEVDEERGGDPGHGRAAVVRVTGIAG